MATQDGSGTDDEIWFTATGEEEGNPLVFRGRLQLPAEVVESEYPYLLSIYWPYDLDANGGMPDQETNNAQVEFEDVLTVLDSLDISFLMLVATGNGRKTWHWYVSNADTWMQDFNRLLTDCPEYPISIESSFEPNWRLYHEFVDSLSGI